MLAQLNARLRPDTQHPVVHKLVEKCLAIVAEASRVQQYDLHPCTPQQLCSSTDFAPAGRLSALPASRERSAALLDGSAAGGGPASDGGVSPFAALQQHIDELTTAKFELQRGLAGALGG